LNKPLLPSSRPCWTCEAFNCKNITTHHPDSHRLQSHQGLYSIAQHALSC
jgi:hypothetical protein